MYKRQGNEYAEQKTFIEFVEGNRAQMKIMNSGTNFVKVLEYKNGELTEVFAEGEFYHIENMLNANTNSNNIVLKEPLEVGNTWSNNEGSTMEITSLDRKIETPSGTYDALEVTTEFKDGGRQREYYAKDIGCLLYTSETAVEGIKGIVSAVIILALAYSLNSISKELGTANYVISIASSWMTPALLLVFTFIISAFIAFFTGTSWGTYAIITPMVVPLAFNLTGGEITTLVYATLAAVMGGGCFGDHCSPLSDTTILSSLAAGADHIDHVKTQIPYALSVAGVSAVLYLVIGIML